MSISELGSNSRNKNLSVFAKKNDSILSILCKDGKSTFFNDADAKREAGELKCGK